MLWYAYFSDQCVVWSGRDGRRDDVTVAKEGDGNDDSEKEEDMHIEGVQPTASSLSDCGAILPMILVAGTATRRAVEATWLTASNPKVLV